MRDEEQLFVICSVFDSSNLFNVWWQSLPAQVDQLGGDTESILLNVLGSDGLGNRFMADRLKVGLP